MIRRLGLHRTAPPVLLLGALLGACAAVPANGEGPADAVDEEEEDDRYELSKKRRALEIAQMELRLEEQQAKSKQRESRQARAKAEKELERAEEALAIFLEMKRPRQLDSSRLSIDRGRYSLEENEAELAELQAMYAQEEFAETTKELVLQRGRRSVEVSKRSLELREREHAIQERELTREADKLAWAVKQAKDAVVAAKRSHESSELEIEIGLARAMGAVRDLEHELEEMEEKAHETAKARPSGQPDADGGVAREAGTRGSRGS